METEDIRLTLIAFTAVIVMMLIIFIPAWAFDFKRAGKAEAIPEEKVIAEIAMPDGSVVSGNVEKYKDYGRDAWEVKINGITYITGKENVVIIKGGVGIE